MKKLLILFLAVGLLTACNNDHNPFAKKDSGSKNKEDKGKEEGDGKDKKNVKDGLFTKGESGNNWTQNDRSKWLNKCEQALNTNAQAKQICSCVLEKLEQKYPDVSDAEQATEEEGQQMIRQCATTRDDYNEDNGSDEDGYVNGGGGDNSYNGDDVVGHAWTKLQRQQYIQGCETTARSVQQGYTNQQIHSYCDCMTSKVEQKYTFQQAMKMTAADFQTREWQNAAADCMSGY